MDLHNLDFQDESACYQVLLDLLHPGGLVCPRCGESDGWGIHRRHRAPVLDYHCSRCRRVFNAWTGPLLEKTHLPPSALVRILRAIVIRQSTADLAREAGHTRTTMAHWRRRLRPLGRKLRSEVP